MYRVGGVGPAVCLLLYLWLQHAHGQEQQTRETAGVAVAAIALSMKSRAVQDSRCYLMSGGAVESFLISEDTPVGAVVGTLSVNGDPREGVGDISLSLQEKSAAVGVASGTKNLTLLRPLDREELSGPSSVYVNVRCDRRHTADPSFIIPVSVRVWDVNDNAPEWRGGPYRARLSELTAVGSRIVQGIRAVDRDQLGPHATIHYSVVPGPNSEYFEFANELDSVLVVKKPLDYETLSNFSVTLRAQDQGSPPLHNDTTLYVEVLDADDQNPKFNRDAYTAILPEDAKEGDVLEVLPEPVSAVDQDAGIAAPLYYSAAGEQRHLIDVQRDAGHITVAAPLLAAAPTLPVTIVLKATQYDNADRYALATLTVTRRSAGARRPLRFLQKVYTAAAPEDVPLGSVLLTLTTNRPGDRTPLQFFVSERGFLEKFAINSAGELVLRRALDYETQDGYHYQVMVTDGAENDTASVNISVLNVNEWEPRFRHPQYEFRVQGAGPGRAALLPVGTLEVFDGDRGDYVTLGVRGADANMFYINDMGEMFLRSEALTALNSSVIHVVATAHDSGAPPRQASVPVSVHVSPELSSVAPGSSRGVLLALAGGGGVLLAVLVGAVLRRVYREVGKGRRAGDGGQGDREGREKGRGGEVTEVGAGAGTGGSLLSVSAGASTILADSTSSLDLRDNYGVGCPAHATVGRQSSRFPGRSKVAPAPPVPADIPTGAAALMSDHVSAGLGRSGVAWPSSTIPARVKKLSWDDAERGNKGSSPRGSLLEASNPTVADHMNLTVYF